MTPARQAPHPRRQRESRHAARLLLGVLVGGGLGFPAWVGAAPLTGAAAISCQEASTTLAMQECLGRQLRQADQDLERYLERAQRRLREERDPPAGALTRAAADLAASQRSWQLSRERYCQALWNYWSGGSVRGPMLLSCRIALARERQRRIWLDFLSFPDGSPPLLPEPPAAESGSRR